MSLNANAVSPALERVHSADSGESREADVGLHWDATAHQYVAETGGHHHHHPAGADLEATIVDEKSGTEKLESDSDDDVYIEFEEGDPKNPFNWPRKKKWIISLCGSWFCFLVAFCASSFSVGISDMRNDLHVSSEVAAITLAVYPLGFGIAPLALAPFSEAYGRNPMYISTIVLFSAFTAMIGAAPNITAVALGRFLSGCAGSSGSTMVGGTLADIWVTHERGLPMSIFSAAAFIGTGLGPAVTGYIPMHIGWRWIQYIQALMGAVTFVVFLIFLRETRGSILLSHRAAAMRKESGNDRWKCKADEERASLTVLIKVSLTRPLYFLFTEPVVFFFSLWVSFVWGVMYGLLEAIPLVMKLYGANQGQIGLAFFSLALGGLIAALANPIQEALYRKNVSKKGPEARLYGAALGGLLVPAGCFIFAWTEGRVHWIAPLIGVTVLMTGIFWIYCAVFNYLADSYLAYASSAIAAQSFARNFMGFVFPLFTAQMYVRLGYDWASFLFGMIALLLAVIPFVLLRYGPQIRARSKFVKEMERVKRLA
ncbi:hypothetical protein PLICRDRAFT_180466 [Plicaturopsis crispa FD-325 SS-3]|uniref:Major facilitator superfamily (MFS) profile domain-containing protein n=1 Tax=Plicaturopsis crispa FD-325 SS-3 TaxID=944288 RepID=A0A0C9T297_PLICR|nr:hypothetical protein PLICRDRAFT_180466 [Plicaturopsis crispa FD-325 SS-3]